MHHNDAPDPRRHILELSDEEYEAVLRPICDRLQWLNEDYPEYHEGQMLAAWDLEELDAARNPSIEHAQELFVDDHISMHALETALERAYRRDPLLLAALDDCLSAQLAQRGITQTTPA